MKNEHVPGKKESLSVGETILVLTLTVALIGGTITCAISNLLKRPQRPDPENPPATVFSGLQKADPFAEEKKPAPEVFPGADAFGVKSIRFGKVLELQNEELGIRCIVEFSDPKKTEELKAIQKELEKNMLTLIKKHTGFSANRVTYIQFIDHNEVAPELPPVTARASGMDMTKNDGTQVLWLMRAEKKQP